ncbi:hypothetical protein [Tenacibaculum ovolyticum]|uniref:hypothetical protein n=1 Tax=Tenacibaculum ovolyticum TaxID=104270 RepID=UPI00042092F8|nr:hypothetical protein [Tenacibaculum ovolyticum]
MEKDLIKNNFLCNFCKESIEESIAYCSNCGHPKNGTSKEIAQFFAKRAMQKSKNIDSDKKIKSAKNTLFVLCGIMVVFGLFSYYTTNDILELSIVLFVALIYLLLAFWSDKKPFIALLSGLLLYLTLIIISAVFDPISLVKGFIWKIIIISYLGKGLYSAFYSRKNDNSNIEIQK